MVNQVVQETKDAKQYLENYCAQLPIDLRTVENDQRTNRSRSHPFNLMSLIGKATTLSGNVGEGLGSEGSEEDLARSPGNESACPELDEASGTESSE